MSMSAPALDPAFDAIAHDAMKARPVVRVEAAGTDPDAAVASLAPLYGGQEWASRRTGTPYEFRYLALGDDQLTLRRSQMHGALRGQVAPGSDYVVQCLTRGTITLTPDSVPLPPGVPVLLPADRPFTFTAEDYDVHLVHLSREVVHAAATERGDHVEEHPVVNAQHAPSPAAIQHWQIILRRASTVLTAAGASSLLWAETSRAVAAALLALYPADEHHLPAPLLVPRNARIRCAVEYMHDHAGEPLTVAAVAEAAGLSVRAVQETFQRVLDTTPMQYLRTLRLEQVHQELAAAEPNSVLVGTVARRWGFTHLGRFSADYVHHYGEYPNSTLRH